MISPHYFRKLSQVNQISIPKEYITALVGQQTESMFVVTLNKSKKSIKLELVE